MEEKQNAALGTAPLGKLMVKFALPCTISLLVGALYNIVDQIFIGWGVGYLGNGATNVVFPLTVLALGLAVMIGDGACSYVSICFGKNRQEDADCAVGSAVTLSVSVGVLVAGFYAVFQTPILLLFGATEANLAYAKEYFTYITVGIPIYVFGQAINPIIRSDGSPRFAMITLLSGAILNCILDPIFIYTLHWGMMGAAVATVIGQIVSAVLALIYLFRMKAVRLCRNSFRVKGRLLRRMLGLGLTSFLSQISIVLSMAAVLNMVKKYGAMDAIFGQEQYAQIPTAVLGIVMKFFQIIMSVSIGLAAGCIPVVGYNMGAERRDRVGNLLRLLTWAEAIVGLVATVIFECFPRQLIGIFGAAEESVHYTNFAIRCIRIFLAMTTLSCINKGAFIFLQAMGKAGLSTALSMLREIVCGVGLPLLLPLFWGLDGIIFFMPLSDIITGVAALYVIISLCRRFKAPAAQSA